MNISGISNESLLGKVLRFPLRLISPQTIMPIMQGKLKGKKWVVGSSIHGCWLGSYEHAKRLAFERIIRENSVVYDIGAHVGFYTLLSSVLVGPRGRVFAFEPFPENLDYLKKHLRLNNIENVTVIEAAVSSKCGTAFFDEGPNSSMGHISKYGRLQVQTVGIDELVAMGRLPAPDYIKMDIEGGEAAALMGASSALSQFHPTIFLATHGRSIQQECCRMLRSMGYELHPIERRKPLDSSSEIFGTYKTLQTGSR